MTWRTTIAPYLDLICLVGYGLGLLAVWGVLPNSLPLAGDKAQYVYAGALVACGYLYWSFRSRRLGGVAYVGHVPARTLSNPQHAAQVYAQRGPLPPPARRAPLVPPQSIEGARPADRTFEAFNR